jgi:hypothetical protein
MNKADLFLEDNYRYPLTSFFSTPQIVKKMLKSINLFTVKAIAYAGSGRDSINVIFLAQKFWS